RAGSSISGGRGYRETSGFAGAAAACITARARSRGVDARRAFRRDDALSGRLDRPDDARAHEYREMEPSGGRVRRLAPGRAGEVDGRGLLRDQHRAEIGILFVAE